MSEIVTQKRNYAENKEVPRTEIARLIKRMLRHKITIQVQKDGTGRLQERSHCNKQTSNDVIVASSEIKYLLAQGIAVVNRQNLQLTEEATHWLKRNINEIEHERSRHKLLNNKEISKSSSIQPRQTDCKDIHGQAYINLDESPLGWLARHKNKFGQPFLTDFEIEAGERLRRDIESSRYNTRTTTNWDHFFVHSSQSASHGSAAYELNDKSLNARSRVNEALQTLGPDLHMVVFELCGNFKGLQDLEKTLGWPRRSAKIIVKMALQQLAKHYRLQ